MKKSRMHSLSAFAAVACLTASSLPAEAQLLRSTSKVGTTAAPFLKIGVGARSIGMGSAQSAAANDAGAIYWNPAALSRLDVSSELKFDHVTWLADIAYDYVAAVMPMGTFGTLGFSVTSMRVPEDLVRTVDFPEGDGRTWDASSLAFGVSYARNLTDRFSIGFNMKYIHESLWNETASGLAFDIGTLYLSEVPGLRLGASIANFGTKMQLDGRDLYFNHDPDNDAGSGPNNIPAQFRAGSYDLPLVFRIGIAYDALRMEDLRVTAATDAVHPNDNTEYVNAGLEVGWRETVFARFGHQTTFQRNPEAGVTWGFGLHYPLFGTTVIKLDYAFAEFGRLKDVQYLSLGLRM